ncbi:MAG: LysE family transporter, partial [Pseudomonadota bacterium]
ASTMTQNLLLLWLAALPLMGSPGPATLSLAGIGSAYGFRAGIPYLVGIVAGTTGVLVLIASGVTAIVLAQPLLVRVLSVLAALYILYLAWKIGSAPVGATADPVAVVPAFGSGLVLALANPKAFAAIGAVYTSQTLVPSDLIADTVAKCLALVCAIVALNTVWLGFGSLFARALRSPRWGRRINVGFALLLVASVGLALGGIV